jgi:enoyl-CoA hydratase/carnithine racemase
MACETILYEVSDNGLTIRLDRSDRLNAFTPDMGRELVEALVPAIVDEIAGRCLAAEDAARSRVTCAAGGSP